MSSSAEVETFAWLFVCILLDVTAATALGMAAGEACAWWFHPVLHHAAPQWLIAQTPYWSIVTAGSILLAMGFCLYFLLRQAAGRCCSRWRAASDARPQDLLHLDLTWGPGFRAPQPLGYFMVLVIVASLTFSARIIEEPIWTLQYWTRGR